MEKGKVLVIDDEQANLMMFRLFLSAYGYEVLVADNGTKGLEIFQKERPRIVFTDIKMPGIDGFEVLKRVKEIDHRVQVIVITGHGDMDLALQALDLEATDFINKPISRNALDSALDRAQKRLNCREWAAGKVLVRKEKERQGIFEVHGCLDEKTGTKLMQDWRQEEVEMGAGAIIHFADTATINGAGIALLIKLLSEAGKMKRDVALTGVSGNFREIFEMVGVTSLAPVFAEKEEGLLYLEKKASGSSPS